MSSTPVTSTPAPSGGEVSKSSAPSQSSAPNGSVESSTSPSETHKIKINGQERELTLAELKNLASKSVGAEERFRQAAQLEKQYKDFTESLKGKQIVKVLEGQGFSKQEIRQALEEQLTPFVQEDLLTPEERERKELQDKLKKFEEERLERDREELSKREQIELDRQLSTLNDEFMSVLESEKLPKNVWLAKQVAQMMLGAQRNGYSMSTAEAAQLVKQQFQSDFKEVIGSMDISQIKQYLGKDTLSKLRAEDVKAVQDVERTFTKSPNKTVKQAQKPSEEKAKTEMSSFFNKLRGVNYNKE